MSEQQRLSMSDLIIGQPIPWDVYGTGNKLLLRRGHVLENQHQAEELVERGLFIDGALVERPSQPPPLPHSETPSALRFINMAAKRLERLLYNLNNESELQAKFLEVTKALTYAANINADIALASLQLNHATANYAVRHCIDTALLTHFVTRAMHKEPVECQSIMAAALTMNIGILRQQDQWHASEHPLSDAEIIQLKAHPHHGADMLAEAGIRDQTWLTCVRMHHEDADGSGYPLGAQVGPIPDSAKILAIADRYCAAVSARKYRKTLLPGAALRDILMHDGKAADPVIAAYFIKELGTTPPGTLVQLQSGEIGVVTQRPGASPSPVVHAFIGPRGAPLSFPIKRDTAKQLHGIRDVLPWDRATLRFSMQQIWGNEAAP